jgi:hypothetical protein
MGQELEHVGGRHLDWVLVDHRKERLQIESDCPQGVRPGPPSHELQIAVDQGMTKSIPVTPSRREAGQARESRHHRTLTAQDEIHADARWITRVLGVLCLADDLAMPPSLERFIVSLAWGGSSEVLRG